MQLASGNYLAGGNYAGGKDTAESAPLNESLDAPVIVSVPKADEVIHAENTGTEESGTEVSNAEVINTDADIDLKKTPELKKKKVEGFYSKKADKEAIAEQPIVKVDDDNTASK